MEQQRSPLGQRGKVPLGWIAADLIVTRCPVCTVVGWDGVEMVAMFESGEFFVFFCEDWKFNLDVETSFLVFLIVLQGCETCGLLACKSTYPITVDQKKSQGQPPEMWKKNTLPNNGRINKLPTSTGFFSDFFQTCEMFVGQIWLRWEHLPMIRRPTASWVSTMLWTQLRFGAIAHVFGRI